MKKIEEAAGELYRQHYPTPSVICAFCEGAAFAQQWYDVNDVLPELKEYCESDLVIVKSDKGSIIFARYCYNECESKFYWDLKSDYHATITHWRPISIE